MYEAWTHPLYKRVAKAANLRQWWFGRARDNTSCSRTTFRRHLDGSFIKREQRKLMTSMSKVNSCPVCLCLNKMYSKNQITLAHPHQDSSMGVATTPTLASTHVLYDMLTTACPKSCHHYIPATWPELFPHPSPLDLSLQHGQNCFPIPLP